MPMPRICVGVASFSWVAWILFALACINCGAAVAGRRAYPRVVLMLAIILGWGCAAWMLAELHALGLVGYYAAGGAMGLKWSHP